MKTQKAMRSEKIQMFDDVAGIIVGAEYVYFVTYKGLKSKEINAFKDELAKCDAQCHVLKNRLINKVAEKNGMAGLAETRLTGDTAVIVGKGDAGQVAKVIEEFSKTSKGVLAPKNDERQGCPRDCRPSVQRCSQGSVARIAQCRPDWPGQSSQCQGYKHCQCHQCV